MVPPFQETNIYTKMMSCLAPLLHGSRHVWPKVLIVNTPEHSLKKPAGGWIDDTSPWFANGQSPGVCVIAPEVTIFCVFRHPSVVCCSPDVCCMFGGLRLKTNQRHFNLNVGLNHVEHPSCGGSKPCFGRSFTCKHTKRCLRQLSVSCGFWMIYTKGSKRQFVL